jgi:hypothetical protein
MARKRKTQMETTDVQTNGTHDTATALAEVPMAIPMEAAPPVNDVRPEAELQQPPPVNGNGTNANRPVHVLTYLIGNDVYAQAQVWRRVVTRRDGSEFVTFDISLRKRYLDSRDNQWKTLYAFSASELYAVHHALEQAARWVAEARAAEDVPF